MKPLSVASIRLFPYFARRSARAIDRYLLLTDSIVAAAFVTRACAWNVRPRELPRKRIARAFTISIKNLIEILQSILITRLVCVR